MQQTDRHQTDVRRVPSLNAFALWRRGHQNVKIVQICSMFPWDVACQIKLITQSLLSPRVKNFENRSTFAEVMSKQIPGRFLMKHGV